MLGKKQYKKNKSARKSIIQDFIAGFKYKRQ